MIDISGKKITKRIAIAEGKIYISKKILEDIKKNKVLKGNVIETSKIAGILGIKNTPFIIPFCHPVKITKAKIDFEIEEDGLKLRCEVSGFDRTGFEMEALTGVCISLLTIYDMCKIYKEEMKIGEIRLIEKKK